MIQPTEFITRLREIYPSQPERLSGSCLKFHLLLKNLYPQSVGLYNGDHIITYIDGKYYDIDGVVEQAKGFLPMKAYGQSGLADFPTHRYTEIFD